MFAIDRNFDLSLLHKHSFANDACQHYMAYFRLKPKYKKKSLNLFFTLKTGAYRIYKLKYFLEQFMRELNGVTSLI